MYIYTLLTLNYILEPAWENSVQRSEDNFEVEYVGGGGLASAIFALGIFFIGKQGVIFLPLKLRFRDQEVDY